LGPLVNLNKYFHETRVQQLGL